MSITATVIADSVSPGGKRLTTMVWRYPRFIHSEIMTHRMFSRNAASSRAIPVKKMLEQVLNDPAIPVYWGKNQAGMQAREELSPEEIEQAKEKWFTARDLAVEQVEGLVALGLHKQIANRILEPWMWMVSVVTATEWGNFYALRRHPDAQPECKAIADAAYEAHAASTPKLVMEGDWHLPFVTEDELNNTLFALGEVVWAKISAARCARVSYLNHDGTSPVLKKDLELHDRLIAAPHASPFEHPATPCEGRHGNFVGWKQYRQLVPNENITSYPGI